MTELQTSIEAVEQNSAVTSKCQHVMTKHDLFGYQNLKNIWSSDFKV